MTSLASWCMDDSWTQDIPVDEAVPMLFRMSVDPDLVHRWLARHKGFSPQCDGSVGLSTDEIQSIDARNKTIYVFSPRPWDSQSLSRFKKEMGI